MTLVVFHSEALRELREASEWYTKKGAPEQGLRSWAQRARLLGWPYTLIFAMHESTAVVLSVAHGKRRPGYWAKRRPKR